MIGLFPYLATGLLLLALFIHLVRKRAIDDQNLRLSSDQEEQETTAESKGIPLQLTIRLFRSEDWDFVIKQGSARLERLFLQQRTALAHAWVQRVRANVGELMRTHRAAARANSRIDLREELGISFEYLLFQTICQGISFMIWLRGPTELGRLIGHAEELSGRLSKSVVGLTHMESASGNSKPEERTIAGLTKR